MKTGSDQEIVQSYPYRSACPSTVWAELASGAREEMFFSGYTSYFLWTQIPAFADLLRHKAAAGCRVRFLLGDPEGPATRRREEIENVALTVSTRIRTTLEHLAALAGTNGIDARFSADADAANHISLSVFRFDDQALVTPHLASAVGHDSPLLHLRRRDEHGLFSRFVEHAEELWTRGTNIATSSP
ncbi:hypothetical protein GCM10010218_47300 [Streptomyces mashuensis]|uniref:Uncharacterized protein n=1 Tax=Streptomyces mashuensis TaxID=33904 RepID=A0A919EF72_9ACTN|nr:XRE family transcriptional regulator [Streptomyces mashuensis]GHF60413.1 hypothetical protein GCM10010218_47300 [Streptomyces mashuensis]